MTTTITMEYPTSALLGRPSPAWYWTGCRCLLSAFTQKCSLDSGLQDQQLTWFSHYISSKRSAMSRGNLCTLHLSIWPRLSTWSVEKASLLYCRGSDVPPKLLRMITSFHESMQGTVQYDGSSLDPFPIRNGVKQGCVLASTLFGIFFSLLLSYAFSQSEDGLYLCTRSNRSLFSLTCLWAKTKVWRVLTRELLFADYAVLTAHTEEALQQLTNCFTCACPEFSITISLKKTKIMGQDISSIPSISIGDCTLEVVEDFIYLGSTISSNLSLDWQGSNSNCSPCKEGLGKLHVDHQHWDEGVSSLCAQHTALWQWCMDSVLPPRTQTQCLPPALTSEGFWASPGRTMSQTRTSWLR